MGEVYGDGEIGTQPVEGTLTIGELRAGFALGWFELKV